MTRAIVAFVVTALVVASVGAALLWFEVDWGYGGIVCGCRSFRFFINVALFGCALAGASAWIGVEVAGSFEWRPMRWLAIAGAGLVPYVILSGMFGNIELLAVGPCCVVATLVEGWTRPVPPLPRATLMRS